MKPLPYLSPAWIQELKTNLQQEITPASGNVTASVVFLNKNVPGGGDKHLYIHVANGMLRTVEGGEGPGPRADFVIYGDYAVFKQVLSGNLSPERALRSGKLRLQGSMLRAMRLTPLIDKVIEVASDIPTVF